METVDPKVYLVTNVASALGQALALTLARTGGKVIIVAKDETHGAGVAEAISRASQNPGVELHLGDLSNLSSVRNLAEVINSKHDKIDVLINNNSIYRKQRSVTVDGFEEMFAANYLGPFLLTSLLLHRLRAGSGGRLLNLTTPSSASIGLDDLRGESRFNSIETFKATRIAMLLFTLELAQRLENSGVTVTAVHPGLVRSEILKDAPLPTRLLATLFAIPPARAAEEVVRLAVDPDPGNLHGKFLHKGKELVIPSQALEPGPRQQLWEISERLTDAGRQGPNYDPTGSVAMYNHRDIPEELIRPEDEPIEKEENGVVKRESSR